MKLNPNEKNAFEAIWQLVRLTNLKITATSLKNALLQHPNFPTFVAFSDVLHDFNVPNLATRLTPDRLHEIPLPAIAHFEGGGGTFITITKIIDDTIEWTHDKVGIKKESIADFLHHWQGTTLLIEPNETSGEVNYKENRKQEIFESLRMPFIITGILTCFGLLFYQVTKQYSIIENWQYYALLFTKTIGLVVSVMLVWYSIDNNNSFLRSVCQLNNRTNCNNILNSKAARIFGWLTWSEVGLFYFAGGFLTLLSPPTPDGGVKMLFIFGILALPYTFWSIYYQAFIAKEWCPLCVTIQVLIWVEFFIFLKMGFTSPISFFNSPIGGWGAVFAFVLTPIIWAFIKKPMQKSLRTDTIYREFQKLKFDPDYIQSLMSKEVFLPPIFEGMKTIEMGNSKAENTLVLALSPYCSACRIAYYQAKVLIEQNNNFKISIILASSFTDNSGKISAIILSQPNENTLVLLDDWFKNGNKWIVRDIQNEGKNQVGTHLRWLEMAGITEVPIVFLNDVKMPKHYVISEIPKLLQVGFANQQ
ncbi:vitamin K epoxide reductase family protein [Emticicia oligotrophica]|uniref:vitamin K epoxide reductase family protein n=1 Tax=Emticicia oligotrophica TaxID=312279 RepID=UPI00273BC778|nr:vitamin K epoxide reductase family protein [Emticicia oligotrophica]